MNEKDKFFKRWHAEFDFELFKQSSLSNLDVSSFQIFEGFDKDRIVKESKVRITYPFNLRGHLFKQSRLFELLFYFQ